MPQEHEGDELPVPETAMMHTETQKMKSSHHVEVAQEINETFKRLFKLRMMTSPPAWVHLDLTMAQMRVLVMLTLHDKLTIGEIAESLKITLPTASHLVERLVQAHLVERVEDAADRRRTFATLTEQGKTLTGEMRGHFPIAEHWLQALTDEELTALALGLQALIRVARQDIDCQQ